MKNEFKAGDVVVHTSTEISPGNGVPLVIPGDIGTIIEIISPYSYYRRVKVRWNVEREGSNNWFVYYSNLVTPEIWNSPLFNALKELDETV